jgi:hypothetical protein
MSGRSPGTKTRAGVEFAISEEDMPALDYAGPRIVGALNFWLINAPVNPDWEPVRGGEPKIELFVYATDPDDARKQAKALYAAMRKEGGLPPQPEPRFVGYGSGDKSLIEFKLGRKTQLERNLENRLAIYESAYGTRSDVKAIVCYTAAQERRVAKVLKELDLQNEGSDVVIDARSDNKPSASKA